MGLGPQGAPVHLSDVGVQLPEAARAPHPLQAHRRLGPHMGGRCVRSREHGAPLGERRAEFWIGDVHKRQRKVMLPAFGSPESKALLPVFRHYAEQVRLTCR